VSSMVNRMLTYRCASNNTPQIVTIMLMALEHMEPKRCQQLLNGVSMIPGVILTWKWLQEHCLPHTIAMYGYMFTCACSMSFHFAKAWFGDMCNKNWLRVDLVGQNVGLMCGVSQTILGHTSPLLLMPCTMVCLIANLNNPVEHNMAFVANFVNIMITYSFSIKMIIQWFIGIVFFFLNDIITLNTHGIGHLIWHLMCHIIIHQSYIHVTTWQNIDILVHNGQV
jgi:hypothetical protein